MVGNTIHIWDKITRWAFNLSIPLLMLDYFLIMLGVNINALIAYPLFGLISLKAVDISFKSRGGIVSWVNVFVLFCLFTFFSYVFNGRPVECFTYSLRTVLFPITFFYLGYSFSSDQEFNTSFILGAAFCFIVGFYLYFTMPDYYLDFLYNFRNSSSSSGVYITENQVENFSRFSSFFGHPYPISYLSVPSLILALSFISGRDKNKLSKPIIYLIAFSAFIAAVLCQMRISMVFALIIPIVYGLYSIRHGRGVRLLLSYFFIVILVVLLYDTIVSLDRFDTISSLVSGRIDAMNFKEAMGERTGQSADASTMSNAYTFLMGQGLGSCSGAANKYIQAVTDMEYVKLFYELGIVGCSILAIIVITTLFRGIRHFKYYQAEVLIIVYFLASALGSDCLSQFFFSGIFWYSMGRIWNKEYCKTLAGF